MKKLKTSPAKLDACRRYREKIRSDPVRAARKKEYNRQYHQKYRQRNADRLKEQNRMWQQEQGVEIRLRRKGLDPEKYASVVREHSGVCDLCGKEPDGRWRQLNIDHCHKNKIFRGILCFKCNRGLGYFQDDPELLRKAATYVERHNTTSTNIETVAPLPEEYRQ